MGNGSYNSGNPIRSNAHTVDWNGIGWYKSGLRVGGNTQDDGAKNVLLEGDADPTGTAVSIMQGHNVDRYAHDDIRQQMQNQMDLISELDRNNLPDVTTADNGKILMVVNGAWKAISINLSVDTNGVLSI